MAYPSICIIVKKMAAAKIYVVLEIYDSYSYFSEDQQWILFNNCIGNVNVLEKL